MSGRGKISCICFLWIAACGIWGIHAAAAGQDMEDVDDMEMEEAAGQGQDDRTAAEQQEAETDVQALAKDMLGELEFGEVDGELEKLFPEERIDFKETLSGILSGDISFTTGLLKRLVSDQLFYALKSSRENLVHILFLAVMAAVFANFGNVFQSRQVSEVAFYVVYLLMLALCLNSFHAVVEWTAGGIESLTSFMGAFCPLYFLAVSVAKGSVTAAAFYHLALFLIFLVELLIAKAMLPLIHVYMMVRVLDFLTAEEYLSKLAELIETVASWTLKTLLACVVGLNVMQGLISPAIDTVKRSVVTRGAEAIPGVGDILGGMTEVTLGTAVLVKNGIGAAGAVFCFALCILPLAQTGCIALMYKLAAALLQPVSDKRIVGCVESVGDGCRLLMRATFTAGLLFLLTIVVVSGTTGNV